MHDANLIYSQGDQFEFGRSELNGLVSTALEHYSHENVPLWRWLVAINGIENAILSVYSIIGSSTTRRVGALEAMRLISEKIPSEPLSDRNDFFDSWFNESALSVLRISALRYLGEFGIASDLPRIRMEFDRNDNQTVGPAADAIIRVNLRNSRDSAIAALYDLQPTSTNPTLLDALFDNDAALSTETLLIGVGHQDSGVRKSVAKVLRARHALPNEIAEKLLSDSDVTVRYEALQSLVENGRSFSTPEAKGILVKQRGLRGIGLLGLGAPDKDKWGQDKWGQSKIFVG